MSGDMGPNKGHLMELIREESCCRCLSDLASVRELPGIRPDNDDSHAERLQDCQLSPRNSLSGLYQRARSFAYKVETHPTIPHIDMPIPYIETFENKILKGPECCAFIPHHHPHKGGNMAPPSEQSSLSMREGASQKKGPQKSDTCLYQASTF